MLTVRRTSIERSNKRLIENKQGEEATVYLYGDLGGWFGIDHLEFVKDFNDIDADTIHLRVDSDGGDIFAARTIKTAIMQHKAKVIAHVDGLAASAASFLIMGADEIEIVEGGFLMIHNALSGLDILGYFNDEGIKSLIKDLKKELNIHSEMNEAIANDYAKRTGLDKAQIAKWMNEEKWINASTALENKFVDRVYDGEPVKGNYDLSFYNNVPDELKRRNRSTQTVNAEINERVLEQALRDAGCTRKQAKEILAKGFAVPDQTVRDAQDDLDDNQTVRDAQEIEVKDDKTTVRDAQKPNKKDRTADLLTRAEVMAPTT